MTVLDKLIAFLFGFLLFEVLYIRSGFLLGFTVSSFTLLLSALLFCSILILYFAFTKHTASQLRSNMIALCLFVVILGIMMGVSYFLSFTFDTSWDGQGYHQTAVIALANGWNPVREETIPFAHRLPSQIFAEGYPSALWEIQSAFYAFTGKINSAKVTNFYMLFLALLAVYASLKKLKLKSVYSLPVAILVTVQPVFIIQMLTFMQDGFGYELLVFSAACLLRILFSSKEKITVALFLLSITLLVSTKYSNIPVGAILFAIFIPVAINRLMNRDYVINKTAGIFFAGFLLVSLAMAYLPYGRNVVMHQALLYPTNIPDLMGAVTYNNVPLNLANESKIALLFYGIFSKSQPVESGDPTNISNEAQLKIPFTFTQKELDDGATLYNNRVGSAGPLFSGILVSAIAVSIIASTRARKKTERYAVYASYFSGIVVILLSLIAPTPNLLRYVNQLQLLPFLLLLPLLLYFRSKSLKAICIILLLGVAANSALYLYPVVTKNIREWHLMTQQLSELKSSHKTYYVRAEQFYSTFTLLKENGIAYTTSSPQKCGPEGRFAFSSTTTFYCIAGN